MNVPKLRFKDDNGQDFPNGVYGFFGDMVEIIMGQSPSGDTYNQKGIGIALINGPTEFRERYPKKIQWTSAPTKLCKKGDILFCVRGSSTGRINISDDEYCIGRGIAAIRGKSLHHTDYIERLLLVIVPRILVLTSGSTFPSVDCQSLKKIAIHIPTLPEQTKIANFLSAVDDKIAELTEKVALLQRYKKGAMQQIFSQQLRFKDDNGQDFPEWEEKILGEIGTFFSGGTPLTSRKEFYNGTIPFIKSGELGLVSTAQTITELGLKNSSAKMVNAGDLLYALYGATSGELAISKIAGAINQAILCIRTNLNTVFLSFYLLFKKESILKTYLQGGQGNLSAEIIKSLTIPCPCEKEQTKIANFLSALDEQINTSQQQLDLSKQYKQSLLQQMFI